MMVSQEVVEKARLSMQIDGRYDNQWHGQCDWTPAQKRRMHGLGLFDMHF